MDINDQFSHQLEQARASRDRRIHESRVTAIIALETAINELQKLQKLSPDTSMYNQPIANITSIVTSLKEVKL